MSTDNYVMMDCVYSIRQQKPILTIFARNTTTKEAVRHDISGFKPYFYCPESESGTAELLPGCVVGEPGTDALGRSIRRVYTDVPGRVAQVRDAFSWTDESDILFDKRYLIDAQLTYAYQYVSNKVVPTEARVDPRICYYDIEVAAPRGIMPRPESAEYPIVTIQVGDSYSGKIFVLTCGLDQTNAPDHIAFDNEFDLISGFMHILGSKWDSDILTGWYSSGFDLPYIIRRCTMLGIPTRALCRIHDARCDLTYNPKKKKNEWSLRLPGRQVPDMLELYKKFKSSESQRSGYDLKSISSEYGLTYTDYGAEIQRLIDERQSETLLEYCRNDVRALMLIDKESGLITFYEYLRSIPGVMLEDTMYNSRIIEMLLMRSGMKPMPRKNRTIMSDDEDTFEGALVLTPPVGLHEQVGCVDLASLYPTIMMAYELSPDVDGIVHTVLRRIFDERERLRAINKSHEATTNTEYQEKVMKYLANSFYGVIGLKSFRLYNQDIAASVTRYGREINTLVHEIIKGLGYSVLYSDTDSTFFSPLATVYEGVRIENEINYRLAKYSQKHGCKVNFKIKLEKIYGRIMFKMSAKGDTVAKKRYAGRLVWKDGHAVNKLDFSGLELKRSDSSVMTHRVLRTFLEILFMGDGQEAALAYVRSQYRSVMKGEISGYDLSLPRGLNSDMENRWTKGRDYGKSLGISYDPVIKPRLVYLKSRDHPEICVTDPHDPIIDRIDYELMAEKTIKNKLSSYIASLGTTWSEIVEGQTNLEGWFS